jgi:hypothetical protein
MTVSRLWRFSVARQVSSSAVESETEQASAASDLHHRGPRPPRPSGLPLPLPLPLILSLTLSLPLPLTLRMNR